jgi:hypothetical protein
MTNARDLTKTLIFRAKNLKEFHIVRDLPDDFILNGPMPYDIKIKDEVITVKVHALTETEANGLVDEFLENFSE